MYFSQILLERDAEKKMRPPPKRNEKALPTGVWKLETYGMMEDKKWTEIPAKEHIIFLIFRNMCLTLQHGQVLIDHINFLTEKVRIIKKHDSLGILVVKEKIKTKKLRMKFAPTGLFTSTMMINQFVERLKPYVSIEDISFRDQPDPSSQLSAILSHKNCTCKTESQDFWSTAAPPTEQTKKCNEPDQNQLSHPLPLNEHVSKILNKRITDFYADNKDLSSLYPLEDIIEACILDPDFPSFVAQVHDGLTKIVLKK